MKVKRALSIGDDIQTTLDRDFPEPVKPVPKPKAKGKQRFLYGIAPTTYHYGEMAWLSITPPAAPAPPPVSTAFTAPVESTRSADGSDLPARVHAAGVAYRQATGMLPRHVLLGDSEYEELIRLLNVEMGPVPSQYALATTLCGLRVHHIAVPSKLEISV